MLLQWYITSISINFSSNSSIFKNRSLAHDEPTVINIYQVAIAVRVRQL